MEIFFEKKNFKLLWKIFEKFWYICEKVWVWMGLKISLSLAEKPKKRWEALKLPHATQSQTLNCSCFQIFSEFCTTSDPNSLQQIYWQQQKLIFYWATEKQSIYIFHVSIFSNILFYLNSKLLTFSFFNRFRSIWNTFVVIIILR